MLELIDVCKSYKGKYAVKDLSFHVDSGEILGLVGANGAGKTTCVSMIATLLKPDSGSISFDGTDVVSQPALLRSNMGFVPQDIALYETLTGLDNLKFWAKTYKIPSSEIKARIGEVGEIIGFDETMLKKKVKDCSGGMKRRLNIGVALMHRPKLVILDEPTTGIDMQSAEQILSAIEQLKKNGTAVIYVGHYMEEVERISTHLCVMDRGECLAFGSKEELLNTPQGRITLAELYKKLCCEA